MASNGSTSIPVSSVNFPAQEINIVFNCLCSSGIIANLILLVYVIYYKRYKTPLFCVIFSLGVSDFGCCVGALLYGTLVTPYIIGPLWMCQVTQTLCGVSYLVSCYHIMLLAILRFTQLVFPLKSHSNLTSALLIKMCLAIWVLHSIQCIVMSSYDKPIKIPSEGPNDKYQCEFTGNAYVVFIWNIIVWNLVPFVTMSGVHIAKQVIVVMSDSSIVMSRDARLQQVRRRTDSRALAIIIVTYLVTILLYLIQVFRVYIFKVTYNEIEAYLGNVGAQLGYSNSAINPWVYLFASESVRADIRKIATCRK